MEQERENRQVVFENEDWYRGDHKKEEEYDGILRRIYHDAPWPAHGGHGPQVTTFYKLDTINAPQLPIKEYILYSHGTTNEVLDKYCGWQVKLEAKLTHNELWCGYLVPLTRMEGERVEVCAKDEWYKKDADQVEDFTGKLSKVPPIHTGGGPGPVVTHFYQLKLKQFLPTQHATTYTIFTNGAHNPVLDKYCNDMNDVRITGKLTKDKQLYPGYLTPLYDSGINPGGPMIPATQPGGPNIPATQSDGTSTHHGPIQYVVFADDEWYKKDHDKVQSWTGKLLQHLSPQTPPGAGLGPVVTHFYELEFSFTRIFQPAKVINSHNSRNEILDKFLNKEVKIIGKLTNNEICPGYLMPVTTHLPTGPGTAAGGSADIVEPRITVCADKEWYKKDEDRVQEWIGTLEKFTPTTNLPPPGTTHVVPVFYQLNLYFAPPIILEETLGLNTEGKHNEVLDQHLNKKVKIIGKYTDEKICPGYLVPLIPGPPHNIPAH